MQSSRLYYEPLTVAHADLLFDLLSDLRVIAHIDGSATTLDAMRAEFRNKEAGPPSERLHELWVHFAVGLQPTSTLIGLIEATCYGSWCEVGYLFGFDSWGKGIASEALNWLMDHLRTKFGIEEFWAAVDPANTRSIKLLERLGFEPAAPGPSRRLASYDPGDLCFRHCASHG
ncbi:MAG: GNAT family N-acetyltransferase [Planctomycetaceae bacterium]